MATFHFPSSTTNLHIIIRTDIEDKKGLSYVHISKKHNQHFLYKNPPGSSENTLVIHHKTSVSSPHVFPIDLKDLRLPLLEESILRSTAPLNLGRKVRRFLAKKMASYALEEIKTLMKHRFFFGVIVEAMIEYEEEMFVDGSELGHCVICLEELGDGRELIKRCSNHMHHESCILQWLKYKNTCPTCRSLIPN